MLYLTFDDKLTLETAQDAADEDGKFEVAVSVYIRTFMSTINKVIEDISILNDWTFQYIQSTSGSGDGCELVLVFDFELAEEYREVVDGVPE